VEDLEQLEATALAVAAMAAAAMPVAVEARWPQTNIFLFQTEGCCRSHCSYMRGVGNA
jgi:hypothetical protein